MGVFFEFDYIFVVWWIGDFGVVFVVEFVFVDFVCVCLGDLVGCIDYGFEIVVVVV